jgi:hypothetical protein
MVTRAASTPCRSALAPLRARARWATLFSHETERRVAVSEQVNVYSPKFSSARTRHGPFSADTLLLPNFCLAVHLQHWGYSTRPYPALLPRQFFFPGYDLPLAAALQILTLPVTCRRWVRVINTRSESYTTYPSITLARHRIGHSFRHFFKLFCPIAPLFQTSIAKTLNQRNAKMK